MEKLPACAIIVDVTRELNAVRETKRLGIPIVGIVDTNGDPSRARLSDCGQRRCDSLGPGRSWRARRAIARGKGVSLVTAAPRRPSPRWKRCRVTGSAQGRSAKKSV